MNKIYITARTATALAKAFEMAGKAVDKLPNGSLDHATIELKNEREIPQITVIISKGRGFDAPLIYT